MSKLQNFRQSFQLFNLILQRLLPQLGERRQIYLHDQHRSAELKVLVKTYNAEEKLSVQATIRAPAHFAAQFKPNCNHDKFTTKNSASSNEELIFLFNGIREAHIYQAFWLLIIIFSDCLQFLFWWNYQLIAYRFWKFKISKHKFSQKTFCKEDRGNFNRRVVRRILNRKGGKSCSYMNDRRNYIKMKRKPKDSRSERKKLIGEQL